MDTIMKRSLSDQELFWRGAFGDEYIKRNTSDELLKAKTQLYSEVLGNKIEQISSCIELGANVGLNLDALKILSPNLETTGVEINRNAYNQIVANGHQAINAPALEFNSQGIQYDLVLINGVLIHQDPSHLTSWYKLISELASNYVIIAESYNPTPTEIEYRGEMKRYFKRDFAKEFLLQNTNFSLIECYFAYDGINSNYDNSLMVTIKKAR